MRYGIPTQGCDIMTAQDVRSAGMTPRRRAQAGAPELTEQQQVRLTPADIHNLQMVRRMVGLAVTDSELIRAILRCAADDILGGYDGQYVTVDVQQTPGCTVVWQRRVD